jgi:hypothetical protein
MGCRSRAYACRPVGGAGTKCVAAAAVAISCPSLPNQPAEWQQARTCSTACCWLRYQAPRAAAVVTIVIGLSAPHANCDARLPPAC